ncbi:hypothetical protein PS662_01590 [Pseudomonas fluorescens]|uniref:Xaa-Pro dipeptidyl-peptidase C-terminal domain-containing protein n=1 Tax=Pseudomonas fluorescens TaxID=294 RepID=A0A5E6RRG1_PSEFL|nr:CocE/NonD family hydrolase C-terminal non-catalytic domain-containing protein [Pseudomonas fluorescens]VVM66748.1 hypothetical protein PS662_01590 [Pseudomonas fluorescens]
MIMAPRLGPYRPSDQRRDDAHSLFLDFLPLTEPLALLGDVRLSLRVASDTTCGQLVARLNAVAPDGQVTQITTQKPAPRSLRH